jgi:hypothetical protein
LAAVAIVLVASASALSFSFLFRHRSTLDTWWLVVSRIVSRVFLGIGKRIAWRQRAHSAFGHYKLVNFFSHVCLHA